MENTTDTLDSDEDMEYLDMLPKEPHVGLVLALEMSQYRHGVLIPGFPGTDTVVQHTVSTMDASRVVTFTSALTCLTSVACITLRLTEN